MSSPDVVHIGPYVVSNSISDIIGRGSFSLVQKAQHRKTGRIVAVKRINLKDLARKTYGQASKYIEREVEALEAVRGHPNVILLHHAEELRGEFHLVLEYCENGNLEDYMKEHEVEEAQLKCFLVDVVTAVHFLHSLNLIHRDLKHENFLLDAGLTVKLADFGTSRIIASHGSTVIGSRVFMAPEVYQGLTTGEATAGKPADVYSTALIIYAMLDYDRGTEMMPLFVEGKPLSEYLIECHKRRRPERDVIEVKEGESELVRRVKAILPSMLYYDSSRRININQVKQQLSSEVEGADSDKEKQSMRSKIKELENERDAQIKKKEEQILVVDEVKAQLRQAKLDKDCLKKQNDDLNRKMKLLEDEKDLVTQDKGDIEAKKRELTNKILILKGTIQSKDTQIHDQKVLIQKLEAKYEEIANKNKTVIEEKKKFNEKLKIKENEKEQLLRDNSRLEDELKASTENAAKLQQVQDETRQSVTDVKFLKNFVVKTTGLPGFPTFTKVAEFSAPPSSDYYRLGHNYIVYGLGDSEKIEVVKFDGSNNSYTTVASAPLPVGVKLNCTKCITEDGCVVMRNRWYNDGTTVVYSRHMEQQIMSKTGEYGFLHAAGHGNIIYDKDHAMFGDGKWYFDVYDIQNHKRKFSLKPPRGKTWIGISSCMDDEGIIIVTDCDSIHVYSDKGQHKATFPLSYNLLSVTSSAGLLLVVDDNLTTIHVHDRHSGAEISSLSQQQLSLSEEERISRIGCDGGYLHVAVWNTRPQQGTVTRVDTYKLDFV